MLVGTAEILVRANTAGFRKQIEADTAPAFGGLRKDAEQAGEQAGLGMRTGASRETGKLAKDMERDGARAGEGLHRGISGGLSKVASVVAATGLPLEGLGKGFETAGERAEKANSRASGLLGTLDKVGGVALAGAAVGLAATAAEGVHLAEGMQSADTAIAAAAGTSVVAATRIGDAFLKTGGKTEFSAQQIAGAYATVAGQLKATEGHALNAAQASEVMAAATDLAEAKQIDLGVATGATSGILQAFKLHTADAAHVTDVLFQASSATGQGVDTLAGSLERVRGKLGETAGPVGNLAGLLVDMTEQGVTGRAAISGLNGAMNTLIKPTKDAVKAQKELGLNTFDANGKFVGLGSVIDQLAPKFATMTQKQQLQAATSLFGAGAARQMLAVINAGPAAYDRATNSVNRHGSAQSAAAKQAATLHGEERTLGAEVSDLATRIGAVLIPVVTAMVGGLIHATTFVTQHKTALIALAAVVTGVLGTAIAVFTVNKMAAFGKSFITASGHVKQFASDVQSAVSKVIGLFGKQTAAADAMATNTETATTAASGAVAAEEGEIGTASAGVETSFAGQATAASTAAGVVETDVAAEATAVGTADTAIETENAAAATSFADLATAAGGAAAAGGAVAAGAVGLATAGAGIQIGRVVTGGSSSHIAGPTGPGNPISWLAHKLGFGAEGAIVSRPTLALIGEAGPEILAPLNRMPGASPLNTHFRANAASGNPVLQWVRDAQIASAQTGIPVSLLLADIQQESGGVPIHSTGSTPGIGNLTQFLPGTARAYGVQLGTSPAALLSQIVGQAKYLRALGGLSNPMAALEGYNSGTAGNPISAGYARSVLAQQGQYRGYDRPLRHTAAGTAAIPAAVSTMLATAQALVGTRYTWGGGHNGWDPVAELKKIGVDCSGFVSQVLHAGGVQLPGPQTTEGLAQNLKRGPGLVTVWDRAHGAQDQQHTLVDIAGRWYESGGRASPGGVSHISAAQAKQELAGGGFAAYHPDIAAATGRALGLGTQTSGLSLPAALKALGGDELKKLVGDIHTNSLKTLSTDLNATHQKALGILDHDLRATHDQALMRLAGQLQAVHEKALAKLNSDLVAQNKANAAKLLAAEQQREIAALGSQATITTSRANAWAQEIGDQTKIALDKQAERGQSGAQLLAAQAQTAFDQITRVNDEAIAAAQSKVDQAASGSALSQAQAAGQLAQAQAVATIQQAQAQSVLDKASAAANAASSVASATGAGAPAPGTPGAPPIPAPITLQIISTAMSPSGLMSELAWALKTGSLPIAAAK